MTDEQFKTNALALMHQQTYQFYDCYLRTGNVNDLLTCISHKFLRKPFTIDRFTFTKGIAGGPNGGDNRIYVKKDNVTRLVFYLKDSLRMEWDSYVPENEDEAAVGNSPHFSNESPFQTILQNCQPRIQVEILV